jgi:GGDEF domain-containing protein
LVLPEISAEYAPRVAQRISQRLAEDAELPRLTVSVGVAEYPRDGLTIEHLLSAADRALYAIKFHAASSSPTLPSS